MACLFSPQLRILAIGDFHFLIYRAAGKPILQAMIESRWLRNAPYVNWLFPEYARREVGRLRAHTLAALRRGNAATASTRMQRDIRGAIEFVIALSRAEAYRNRLAEAG